MRALRSSLVFGLLFLVQASSRAAAPQPQPPPPAATVLTHAQARARAEHKEIFFTFHASWCVWCRALNAYVRDPRVSPILKKYFVFASLTVEEHGPKAELDNPGAERLMDTWGNASGGLPYIVFLDQNGRALVNSKSIGYPVQPTEIAWFNEMLKRAIPTMPAVERKTLIKVLRERNRQIHLS